MEKRSQKGFAMILTLFLVVVLSTMVVGDFLSLSRQQRTVQGMVDRIKLNWINESLIDRTLKLFSNFVNTNGRYPDTDSSKCITIKDENDNDYNACEVRYNVSGDAAGTPFKDTLETWYPSWASLVGNLTDITVDTSTFSVRQIDGAGDLDPYRTYRIEFKISKAASGTQNYVRHDVKVVAGKLFDFFSFANEDLEICPGPSFDLEGPIFSNGDVYLMTAPGNTLTLSAPDDMDPTDKHYYALHAAGNIYFYFKRAVARNYFLDPGRNDVYKNSVANFFRTDDPSKSGATTWPCNGGMWDGNGYWTLCSPCGGCWASWPGVSTPGLTGPDGYAERFHFGLPVLYNFKNDIYFWVHPRGKLSPQDPGIYPKLQVKKGNQDPDPGDLIELTYPEVLWKTYNYWPTSKSFYNTHYAAAAYSGFMNVSPAIAMDPWWSPSSANWPKMLPGWTPEDPKTTKPLINPNWLNPATNPTGNLLSDHLKDSDITQQTIPIGNLSSNAHTLIEPVTNLDSPAVKRQKLWSKAHIQLRCNPNDNCQSFVSWKYTGAAQNNGYELVDSPPGWASIENLWDYRLGGRFKTIVIDVSGPDGLGGLKEYLKDEANGLVQKDVAETGFQGYLVYVETANAPYKRGTGEDRIVLVKLKNGVELPKDGLTVVTNGRLWVEGDYNTVHYDLDEHGKPTTRLGVCSDTDWGEKNCHFPAAAIFSDSMGVLSGAGAQTGYSGPTVNDRVVSNNVMVNAAVVSGYLPSQLEEAYPNCNTSTALDPTKCFDHPLLTDAENHDSTKYYDYNSGGNTVVCADGFDAEGFPNNPQSCWKTLDRNKGIYNTRTIKFMSGFIKARREEWYGYDANGRAYDASGAPLTPSTSTDFRGCRDRIGPGPGTWTELEANGGYELDTADIKCPGAPNVAAEPWKKLYEDTVLDWNLDQSLPAEHLTTSEMGTLKNSALNEYKIPVEGWNSTTNNWDMYCCDALNPNPPRPDDECAATPYVCGPSVTSEADWATRKSKVFYRKFTIDFNSLPEISNYGTADPVPTLPWFSSGLLYCSDPNTPNTTNTGQYGLPGYQWTEVPYGKPGLSKTGWLGNSQVLDYKHGCQIAPAPLMGGTWLDHMNPDPATNGRSYLIWVPASDCDPPPDCTTYEAQGLVCPSQVCHTPSQAKLLLRAYSLRPAYGWGDYMPLWIPRYSGGLENFINYQELWEKTGSSPYRRTIFFNGVLTKTWDSKQLETSDASGNNVKKAFYDTSYYTAPARAAHYNQDLRRNPPSGTPGIYSLKRSRYQSLDPKDRTKVLGA